MTRSRRTAPILGSVLALATALVVASAHDRPAATPAKPPAPKPVPVVAAGSTLDGRVLAGLAGQAVAGRLTGRTVLLVTVPGTRAVDVQQVVAALVESGAQLSGTLAITPAYIDPVQARELENLVTGLLPPGVVLPARRSAGTVAGAVIARALVGPTPKLAGDVVDDADALMAGLVDAGFARVSGKPSAGATLAVVLSGAARGADPQPTVALSAALAARAAAVVAAGPHGATGPRTLVAALRSGSTPRLSTIDAVDTVAGRYAVPLALLAGLGGRTGRYGDGAGADAPMPPLPR